MTLGDCWNRIGTSGDRSCPELQTHIHCRNCPVFASAARTFFDRPAPDGYLAEWTQWLAGSTAAGDGEAGESAVPGDQDRDRESISVLIFRLGQEWLAFRTQTVAEVTLPRPVHRIPHRSNEILIGLVNLRGQLQLCVSLHGLLGVDVAPRAVASARPGPPAPAAGGRGQGRRGGRIERPPGLATGRPPRSRAIGDLDLRRRGSAGRPPAGPGTVRSVSSSLANPEVSFSQAILSWEGRSVGFLDEQRVFAALRSIGQ